MNDNNEPSSAYAQHRASLNVVSAIPTFSNPFTRIVRESQAVSASPNRAERGGKLVDGAFGKERRPFELKSQTPQKRPRLFQPPSLDTVTTLSPYVKLLNTPKSGPIPMPQFRSHNFQRPSLPLCMSAYDEADPVDSDSAATVFESHPRAMD